MADEEFDMNPQDVPDDIMKEIGLLLKDHRSGAFLSSFRAWAEDPTSPVEDPSALLAADGIDLNGPFGPYNPVILAIREIYIEDFGHCVPTQELVEALVTMGPLLEVGAGLGFLARLIRNAGGDIIATDLAPPSSGAWLDIHGMDAEDAVRKYPGRSLLCSWPTQRNDGLTRATRSLTTGARLISIGERGASTGTPCFDDLIGHEIEVDDALKGAQVWTFPMMYDRAESFRRI